MINFSTDYHLGMVLSTHTSHDSRNRLRIALYHQALSVINDRPHDEPHYCLGDLVHTYKNDETTIQQCMTLLGKLTNCIMGNHDVTNRSDAMGTLELLEPLYDVVPAEMGKCDYMVCSEEGTVLYMVPHTNSQQLFQIAMNNLSDLGDLSDTGSRILMLHCNYEFPWESNETTLNLTKKTAKELLKKFDYILIGHEHNYREELDGRVILLGNIHPTNFGDISDKYRWTYDGKKMEKHLIWSKAKHFLEIKAFSEDEIDENIQFIKIVGKVDAADHPIYCRWVSNLWKRVGKKVYAIRSAIEIIREEVSIQIDEAALQNLMDTIAEELKEDKDLAELFDELRGEIS